MSQSSNRVNRVLILSSESKYRGRQVGNLLLQARHASFLGPTPESTFKQQAMCERQHHLIRLRSTLLMPSSSNFIRSSAHLQCERSVSSFTCRTTAEGSCPNLKVVRRNAGTTHSFTGTAHGLKRRMKTTSTTQEIQPPIKRGFKIHVVQIPC